MSGAFLFIAILAGLFGATIAVASGRSVRLLLLIGFFLSSIALQLDYFKNELHTLLYPIQSRRTEAVAALSVLLWLNVLVHGLRSGALAIPIQTFFLLLLGMYAGVVRVVHDGFQEAVFSLIFAVLTIPIVSSAVVGYVREREDVLRIMRMIAATGIVWTFFVGLQFLSNRSHLTLGNSFRFMGLLSNPQHAGAFVGSVLVVTFWLVINDPTRRLRLIWIGMCMPLALMLLWTGSRTALLMFVVGFSVSMYGRFGRLILWAPVGAFAVFIAMQLADMLGISLLTNRLASTENTREVVWSNMLQNGLANPIVGVGQDEAGGSENGYLYGFSSFGVGMLLLMLLYTAVSGWVALKLYRMRSAVNQHWRMMIDVVLGLTALYYAGGMFEGYFLSRVSPNHFLMLIISGLAYSVFKLAPAEADEHAPIARNWEPEETTPATRNFGEGYDGPYAPA